RYLALAAEMKAAPGDPDPRAVDDFAASGIADAAEIVDVFTRSFYFGCESDDPLSALAFDGGLLPGHARLNAGFGSDIGHWDVPDMRGVLPEAWELVEDGHLDADAFRDFTFGNVVRFFTAANPEFFAGTAVADAVRKLQPRSA